MLPNAYLLAKIGADTAENEQHFAEILPIGRRVAEVPAGREAVPVGMRRLYSQVRFLHLRPDEVGLSDLGGDAQDEPMN